MRKQIENTRPSQYSKMQSIPSFNHFCLSPTSDSFNRLSSKVVCKWKMMTTIFIRELMKLLTCSYLLLSVPCRVPLHKSFKSRQVAGRASTHCRVPYGSGSHLPVKVGFGAAMCSMASDLISRMRWTPALSCVP
jgi:hypothetical protein